MGFRLTRVYLVARDYLIPFETVRGPAFDDAVVCVAVGLTAFAELRGTVPMG